MRQWTPTPGTKIWGSELEDCEMVLFYDAINFYLGYRTSDNYVGYWTVTSIHQGELEKMWYANALPRYTHSNADNSQHLSVSGSFPDTWEEVHESTTSTKEIEMTPTWEIVDAVLNHSRRVLLLGPPGTGKTYAATRRGLEVRENKRVYSVTMTPETPAAEMRGHYVPKDREMVWQDGPAIRAWREGSRLVINEIDHASPDCLSLLFAVLDDPEFAEFTLPTGETVRPNAGFQIVATMNGEVEDLPPALQDRFPVSLEILDLNPEAIQSLPEDLQYVARNTALHPSEERRLSIRAWAEFANLRKRFRLDHGNKKGLQLAAEAVFGARAEEALNALEMAEDTAA